MTSSIANNTTANKFNELQKNIDTCRNDQEQLNVMYKMRGLLCECKGSTPIYDWGVFNIETSEKVVTTAADQLDSVNRRISRFESQIARTTT